MYQKFKHDYFDFFSVACYIILGAFVFIFILGSIPDDPVKITPWKWPYHDENRNPQSMQEYLMQHPNSRTTQSTKYFIPYEPDTRKTECNEYTIEWQDYLEELDQRGISLDDPEAAEIWEEFH